MTAHVPWREPPGVIQPRRPSHVTRTVPTIPLAEFDALRRQLDQAYERWLDGEGRTWAPAIDVERGDKALTVRADFPGVDPAWLPPATTERTQ